MLVAAVTTAGRGSAALTWAVLALPMVPIAVDIIAAAIVAIIMAMAAVIIAVTVDPIMAAVIGAPITVAATTTTIGAITRAHSPLARLSVGQSLRNHTATRMRCATAGTGSNLMIHIVAHTWAMMDIDTRVRNRISESRREAVSPIVDV